MLVETTACQSSCFFETPCITRLLCSSVCVPESCQCTVTSLGNSGLCWTVFARNRDTAVPAERNGDLQTLICVLVVRPRRCLTLSNPVPWQNRMVAYLGYTLRMKTLFRGWPVMVHDTHTRRRRRLPVWRVNCCLVVVHCNDVALSKIVFIWSYCFSYTGGSFSS